MMIEKPTRPGEKSGDYNHLYSRSAEGSQVLGLTQEERGSELMAGARAMIMPSPLHYALSSIRGRTMARLYFNMPGGQDLQRYVQFRNPGQIEMFRRGIPAGCDEPRLLEPYVGFGILSLSLAETLPQATVFELDRPNIIAERQRRLAGMQTPTNIQTLSADLHQLPLHELLGGEPMHVILSNGLYLTSEEYTQALRYLRTLLAPDGAIFAILPWAAGTEQNVWGRMYKMQISKYPGAIRSHDQFVKILNRAGFYDVQLFDIRELGQEINYPHVANFEIWALARQGYP